MSDYLFQSTLYPTAQAAHLAIAQEYLTAGGQNNADAILTAWEDSTDGMLALETEEMWSLRDLGDWYSTRQLADAYRAIRKEPARYLRQFRNVTIEADPENMGIAFWDYVRETPTAPAELLAIANMEADSVSVPYLRAQQIKAFCASAPGFSDGPKWAQHAVMFNEEGDE